MIDLSQLPDRCLMDTGVLIRALRQQQTPETEACEAFFKAMVSERKTILIAAPSLAELLRSKPDTKAPISRSVMVVPFDHRAAEILAENLPWKLQKTRAAEENVSRAYIKYDAMIAACAKRWNATVIISIDGDHRKLAKDLGIESRSPDSYRMAQLELKAIEGGKSKIGR